mmetsp:Transcript_8585/g.15863  ORF Transcript_8585/g.15863 Transcript_8585/m.15863 type:complete len:101 (+) Transcript_8585:257-559(+)
MLLMHAFEICSRELVMYGINKREVPPPLCPRVAPSTSPAACKGGQTSHDTPLLAQGEAAALSLSSSFGPTRPLSTIHSPESPSSPHAQRRGFSSLLHGVS